jgi:hypothetical protein
VTATTFRPGLVRLPTRAVAFTTFAERVLKLELTPGQRVLCRVAFDGIDPEQLDETERWIARELFGAVETFPDAARRIQVLVLGRGSGKTTLAAAFALYVMLTADVTGCGPGDVPVVVVIAPDRRTASLSIRMAREMAKRTADVARLIESDTADGFTLRRPDGRLVALEAFAASRGGSSARGRSILSFVLDEAFFFRSDEGGGYVVNDRDLYRALIPRLMKGGKGIFISTPWPVETLMGELFAKNHGTPSTALAAKAPTLLMRGDDPELAATIATERERDPENCAREFDCDMSIGGGAGFFDHAAINTAVDDIARPLMREPRYQYAAGADFAFRSDSSALVVVQYDGTDYSIAETLELRPTKGQPLAPSKVVKDFAEVTKSYGCPFVIADGHYREAIHEQLQADDLALSPAPEGQLGKIETYSRARALLHEGRVRLPNDPRLLSQLRSIVSKPTQGGSLSISAPRRAGGGHGDLVSAWVLAVHHLTHAAVKPDSAAVDDEERRRQRRRKDLLAATSRAWWRGGARAGR